MALGVVCMMKAREEDRAATSSLLGHAFRHAKSPGVAEPVLPFDFSFIFQSTALQRRTARRIRVWMGPLNLNRTRIHTRTRYHSLF